MGHIRTHTQAPRSQRGVDSGALSPRGVHKQPVRFSALSGLDPPRWGAAVELKVKKRKGRGCQEGRGPGSQRGERPICSLSRWTSAGQAPGQVTPSSPPCSAGPTPPVSPPHPPLVMISRDLPPRHAHAHRRHPLPGPGHSIPHVGSIISKSHPNTMVTTPAGSPRRCVWFTRNGESRVPGWQCGGTHSCAF